MASLKDVAEKAGVSLSTASRALSGQPGLSEKTYRRLRQVADELNYAPNPSARLLAGKNSRIIGIVVPEIYSNYFATLIYEIETLLQERGYFLLIMNTLFDRDKERNALQTFCNFRVDGVFLPASVHSDVLEEYIRTLNANGIACVGLEALLNSDSYSYIQVDDTQGMTCAIRYLLEKGHTRIGFLSDYLIDELRVGYFREALVRNGLSAADNPVYSHPTKRHEESGYETMQRILQEPNRPDALLAGYDDLAVGAIRAIEEAGLSVPEDFAIIANDNIRSAPYLHKALSTLSPPVQKMARLGVDILLRQIEDRETDVVQHIILKPELILRETC